MSEFFDVETAVNYEQKELCACLLLDASHSMEGKKLNLIASRKESKLFMRK